MREIQRSTKAPPKAVFQVLANGWLFSSWVVGAARMRSVDDSWPGVGSKLHHSFGIWPLLIDDTSTVLQAEPPHLLVVQARGWPMGEATVEIRIDESGTGSLISIREDATRGPGLVVPGPVRQVLIGVRNREALRRLALLAEGQA